MKKKLLLSSYNFLGDNTMLTVLVKYLAKQYGNMFEIGVFSQNFYDVFKNNPYISNNVSMLNKDIFLRNINYYNKHDYYSDYGHSVFGFKTLIEKTLNIELFIENMSCDIYLTEDEKQNKFGDYWVINAGYMENILVKHYPYQKFSEIVNILNGKIKFVQVGVGKNHIPIPGCIDMTNKTSLRELFGIIYNSKGTLSPISSTLHLSTMVSPNGRPRPAVVIAGGRENNQLFCYNNTFPISNVGFYDCCTGGGCLRRNDCNHKISVGNGKWCPKCMYDISPEMVAEMILYCSKYYS